MTTLTPGGPAEKQFIENRKEVLMLANIAKQCNFLTTENFNRLISLMPKMENKKAVEGIEYFNKKGLK